MARSCEEFGLGTLSVFHEFSDGQFEINLVHSDALDAADRAFRQKIAVKDLAFREGMLATFVGRPWNEIGGSGFHVHLSLRESGRPAFADPSGEHGLSDTARHFVAGVLAHMPALVAVLNPTVNAYKRIAAGGVVSKTVSWGLDNRFTLVRVPSERGSGARIEVRIGDGAANPYLAFAVLLAAGLDGLERELVPPAPLSGDVLALPEDRRGVPLPSHLRGALDALRADAVLREALGEDLVKAFVGIKEYELARFEAFVTDWEFDEYALHL
jgi:glutamine synthetase